MKEIGIEELKKLQVEILLKVHQFCQDNSIEYSLDSGTLLGAIRHKGYIPWDDDIDVIMTRPNYDKFIKSFNGYSDNYYVLAPELNWKYYAPYANVCDKRTVLQELTIGHNNIELGVKIDIFPIDGCPDEYDAYIRMHKKLRNLNNDLLSKRVKLNRYIHINFKRSIVLFLFRLKNAFRSYTKIQKEINKLSTSYDYNKSAFATLFVCPFKPLHVKKAVFESFVDVDFEGYKLKGIKDFDIYLTALYGNYMQLPPENERVYQHGFNAYWK